MDGTVRCGGDDRLGGRAVCSGDGPVELGGVDAGLLDLQLAGVLVAVDLVLAGADLQGEVLDAVGLGGAVVELGAVVDVGGEPDQDGEQAGEGRDEQRVGAGAQALDVDPAGHHGRGDRDDRDDADQLADQRDGLAASVDASSATLVGAVAATHAAHHNREEHGAEDREQGRDPGLEGGREVVPDADELDVQQAEHREQEHREVQREEHDVADGMPAADEVLLGAVAGLGGDPLTEHVVGVRGLGGRELLAGRAHHARIGQLLENLVDQVDLGVLGLDRADERLNGAGYELVEPALGAPGRAGPDDGLHLGQLLLVARVAVGLGDQGVGVDHLGQRDGTHADQRGESRADRDPGLAGSGVRVHLDALALADSGHCPSSLLCHLGCLPEACSI